MRKPIAEAVLRLSGWKPEGVPPDLAKYVLIAAPHTSNWDLLLLLALAERYGVRISFMMKESLFRGPFGPFFRGLGGIPIRRDRRNDLVKQMVERFAASEALVLVVPAEGTRARVDLWKSGFYHIASQARVPIVLGYLDYARRRGGFGPAVVPSGDVRGDMDQVREFYADKVGRFPDLFAEPRLREEG